MNTQTHLLVSAFALARPDKPLRNSAVIFGALLPDLSIYALVVWARINDVPERQIWRHFYWQEPWQTYGAILNSVPIYGAGLLLCLFLLFRQDKQASIPAEGERHRVILVAFAAFFASCLLHVALDFPVHVDDAHRHFWPISDWRFHSPISYWNSNHHGDVVQTVEMIAGVAMVAVLFLRFRQWWVRSILTLALLAYIAVPLYWTFQFSS